MKIASSCETVHLPWQSCISFHMYLLHHFLSCYPNRTTYPHKVTDYPSWHLISITLKSGLFHALHLTHTAPLHTKNYNIYIYICYNLFITGILIFYNILSFSKHIHLLWLQYMWEVLMENIKVWPLMMQCFTPLEPLVHPWSYNPSSSCSSLTEG